MENNRRFASLVLRHLQRVGDIHEHDEAGRLLGELEERDYKSQEVAPEADQSVAKTPQSGDQGANEGELKVILESAKSEEAPADQESAKSEEAPADQESAKSEEAPADQESAKSEEAPLSPDTIIEP